MHALLLALAAAPPQAHVALADVRDTLAPEIQQLVAARLVAAGIAPLPADEAATTSKAVLGCKSNPKCFAELAKAGRVLVTIDLGKLSGMLVGHFEAIEGKQVLASIDFAVPREKWRNDIAPFVTTLVSSINVHLALDAAPEKPVVTAPAATVVAMPAPRSSSAVLPLVLGGGTVAFAAAAGALGYLSLADVNTFNRSRYTVEGMAASTLDRQTLDRLANSANLEATAAWLCAGAAAVLLAATVWAILTGT